MSTLLPSGPEKTIRVRAMFDAIAPRYDFVNRLITFGLDQRWRRITIDSLGLPENSLILDLACGTGALGEVANERGYRVVGADLSAGMLRDRKGNWPVTQSDASALALMSASVDGVICAYALRNFTDLAASLGEAARVIRPGGRIAILEVDSPTNALLALGHNIWFRKAVPLIGGLFSDRSAYRYLPRSTAYLPDHDALIKILRDAGFSGVNRRTLLGGASQILCATRVGAPN